MNKINRGDLAIVVQGLWPNVGRIVYVCEYVTEFDFTAMGLSVGAGWRVRSWSGGLLTRTDGLGLSGITPIGSLRPLDRLPKEQQREIEIEMALAEAAEAIKELAAWFAGQEALEKV